MVALMLAPDDIQTSCGRSINFGDGETGTGGRSKAASLLFWGLERQRPSSSPSCKVFAELLGNRRD
ncbi:hypothetical protein OUZ56_013040 [Daphnia magna]|uniref:Uncharacterized protein n=1 Tax=Daphnia magna TaxID=35525 RepID=A0ABQ9Z4R5_9CRUS|nr:hypothetical protein OUZ56_013040 [Daphnia magna]